MPEQSLSPNQQDQRSGWKFLGIFALVFIAGWIAGIIAGLVARQIGLGLHLSDPVGHTLSLLSIFTARFIVWVPATHVVLKRRLRDITFPLKTGWWSDMLAGIGIASLAMLAVFVVSERAGWLVIEGWRWQILAFSVLLGTLSVTLLNNILVAIGEELVFRAYLLTGLKEAWGKWRGLAVMMVVFGVLHLPAYIAQEMNTPVLIIAISLAAAIGATFGLAYLRTGTLWLPFGMHFAWNFVENDILNLSGDLKNDNLIGAMTRLQGPVSPIGAGYGNAIVLDAIAFIILCFGLWLWMTKRTD